MTSSVQAGRPLVRGLALVNDLVVARKMFGDRPLAELERRLSAEQRLEMGHGFEAARWYDERIQVELMRVLTERFPPEEQFAMGVAIARHNINTVQRFLARLAGPKVLLKRAAAIWSYWRNTGVMEVGAFADGSATVFVREHTFLLDPPYANSFGGACAYMVHATGAAAVRLCVTTQAPSTVRFDVRWGRAPTAEEPGYHGLEAALRWCDQPR